MVEQPDTAYYTTFRAFERLSKVRHTLRSAWSKMVSSVSGTSEEQCEDILERFSTPISFLAAIEDRDMQKSVSVNDSRPDGPPEAWLKRELDRNQPRPMYAPVSERYWNLFTKQDYDDGQSATVSSTVAPSITLTVAGRPGPPEAPQFSAAEHLDFLNALDYVNTSNGGHLANIGSGRSRARGRGRGRSRCAYR